MDRALVIQKCWLDKIFDEGKVWEMRSTKTSIRGKIGLIEAGTGLIVGEAELTDSFEVHPYHIFHARKKHKVDDLLLLKKWKCAWVLKDAKRYKKPIPYSHPKGAVIWVKL